MGALPDLNLLWPLAGGILIGLAAAVYLLLDGRIAGVSGLVASAAGLSGGGRPILALGFIGGILAGAAFAMAVIRTPDILITSSAGLLLLGGLLVGFGTRMGAGCTSGHGVCGLARLSPRSLAATGTFMAIAIATVFVVRHILGGGGA